MATITQETRVTLRNREAVALGHLGGHVVECLRGDLSLPPCLPHLSSR